VWCLLLRLLHALWRLEPQSLRPQDHHLGRTGIVLDISKTAVVNVNVSII
jgi:hypothetical protein